jgi:hypothetical protein
MTDLRSLRLLVAVFAGVLLAGCGGGVRSMRVTSEFTSEDAELFEDGFDFVKEPGALEGQWLDDWQKEIKARVANSDFIAVVTVTTLRTDVDLDRQVSYRVVGDIERRLYGDLSDSEIELTTDKKAIGYASVKDNQDSILNRVFVAYVKWYENEDGEVAGHWHLSPGSEGIVGATENLVKERTEEKKQLRRTVVVHKDTY